MSNATLLDAIRAASPEERQSAFAEYVNLVLADAPARVPVKDTAGGLVGWFVPNQSPPPITQADIDELNRRWKHRHQAIDAEVLLAEYERKITRTG